MHVIIQEKPKLFGRICLSLWDCTTLYILVVVPLMRCRGEPRVFGQKSSYPSGKFQANVIIYWPSWIFGMRSFFKRSLNYQLLNSNQKTKFLLTSWVFFMQNLRKCIFSDRFTVDITYSTCLLSSASTRQIFGCLGRDILFVKMRGCTRCLWSEQHRPKKCCRNFFEESTFSLQDQEWCEVFSTSLLLKDFSSAEGNFFIDRKYVVSRCVVGHCLTMTYQGKYLVFMQRSRELWAALWESRKFWFSDCRKIRGRLTDEFFSWTMSTLLIIWTSWLSSTPKHPRRLEGWTDARR